MALGDEGNLQFRAEVFNLANRSIFGDPRSSIWTRRGQLRSDVGRISGTRTSTRQIQLALKITF